MTGVETRGTSWASSILYSVSWQTRQCRVSTPQHGRFAGEYRGYREVMTSKRKSKGAYMISAVAEMYGIHPQTLRLYEREGLLKPSRTEGNTRLYTDEDLQRL